MAFEIILLLNSAADEMARVNAVVLPRLFASQSALMGFLALPEEMTLYSLLAILLSAAFAALVGFLLLKQYRKRKRKSAPRSLGNLRIRETEQTLPEGVFFFSPTLFSSENVPAIFVVENDNDLRLFIVNTLRLNYRVLSVSDTSLAHDRIAALMPDLVIVGDAGPDLPHQLRTSLATAHIPVFRIVTGKDTSTSFCDDALPAPFDARDLLLHVHTVIKKRKQLRHESEKSNWSEVDQAFITYLYKVLEENYMEPDFSPERLSEETGLTRLQLFRKLKALVNKTPASIIRTYRLHKAKELLEQNKYPVSEVAQRTGFGNVSSLNKAFRQQLGITAAEYVRKKSGRMNIADLP